MSIFCRLFGRHYFSVPHRSSEHRLVQICYECGSERQVAELQDEISTEGLKQKIASARVTLASDAQQRSIDANAMIEAKPRLSLVK